MLHRVHKNYVIESSDVERFRFLRSEVLDSIRQVRLQFPAEFSCDLDLVRVDVDSNQSGCSHRCQVGGTPAGAAADLEHGLALRFEAGIEREHDCTALELPGEVVLECVPCVWCCPAFPASEPNEAAQAEFSK